MKEIKKRLNSVLIGQEKLINDVCDYFEEKIEQDQKGVICILGEKDTGKKALIKMLFELLKEEGKTNSDKVEVLDVSSYNFNFGYNLFLTDLYESLNSDSEVVIFKNFQKGREEILSVLSGIYPNTCIKLSEKYIMKNKILVEADKEEKNEIEDIVCHNKFFVFVSDEEVDLNEIFNDTYVKNLKVFKSEKLSDEERYKIIKRIVESNVEAIKESTKVDLWINLNEDVDDERYDLCKFIYESFKSDEALDVKKYVDYKLLKPVKNLINRLQIEEGSKIIVYRKDDNIYCSDGREEYNLSDYSDTTLEEAKYKLNSIIGVKELKDFIETVENHVKVQSIRKKLGLKVTNTSLNMIFAGNAGTGKTNAARITFEYLNALGLLSSGVFREVSKSDFVSENLNDTAKVTMNVINSAIGGVLFIDEAYSLCEGEHDKVGKEIIETLLKGIEDNRENLVVIMAGYEKDMEKFLSINQGLKSRFSNIIHFYDYTPEEMYEIAINIAKSKGYRINPNIKNDIIDLFYKNQISGKNDLGNARFVRNIVENAIMDASKKYISGDEKQLDVLDFKNFNFKVKSKFNLEKKLDEIIGLESVKDLLRDQYKLIIAQEKRKSVGVYTKIDQNLNMVFAGNPGTGKTSIARLVAEMLNSIGLLKSGQLIETDRSHFVTGEKGSTAKKTEEVFKKAIGGVLFIDEAYTLANDDLGIEAIETLLKLIEDYGDQVVVILAGYEKELEDFFDVNIGLKSRFPLWTKFEDYNPEELLNMAIKIIDKKGFKLSKNGYFALKKSFVSIYEDADAQSGNGRMVRNYVENLIRIQSIRISENDISIYDMNLITAKDIENIDISLQSSIDIEGILSQLVCRNREKEIIRNIYDFLKLKEVRRKKSINVNLDKSLNLMFAGEVGAGKKSLGRVISELFCALGVTKTKNIMKMQSRDIIKRLQNETIDEVLGKTFGKTVCIGKLEDFLNGKGGELALNEISRFLEANKGKMVIIFSGKEEEIKELLYRNQTFGENFLEYIKLENYTSSEITEIVIQKLINNGLVIDEKEIELIKQNISEFTKNNKITLKNGILAQNYVQIIGKVQGIRVSNGKLSNYLNTKIEKIDILESKEEFLKKFEINIKDEKKKENGLNEVLKLKELLDENLISREEFESMKKDIFNI